MTTIIMIHALVLFRNVVITKVKLLNYNFRLISKYTAF